MINDRPDTFESWQIQPDDEQHGIWLACRDNAQRDWAIQTLTVPPRTDELQRLREVVRSCMNKFDFYAKQHHAKGTEDSLTKAIANERMAALCRVALEESPRPAISIDEALLRAVVDVAWGEATESEAVPSIHTTNAVIERARIIVQGERGITPLLDMDSLDIPEAPAFEVVQPQPETRWNRLRKSALALIGRRP